MKIWIGKDNERYSAIVQEALFSLGYSWATKGKTPSFFDATALFTDFGGTLTWWNSTPEAFELDARPEFRLGEFVEVKKKKLVEVLGKVYLEEDVLKILQTINSVNS